MNDPEPIIHSHKSDRLPAEHPLARKDVCCAKCKELVHAWNNECMQTWVEIEKIPFCMNCALPCFQEVLTYAPLMPYIPKYNPSISLGAYIAAEELLLLQENKLTKEDIEKLARTL